VPGDADIAGQFDKWIAEQDLMIDAAAHYPLTPYFPPPKQQELRSLTRKEELAPSADASAGSGGRWKR
jgi:hypothetical protein